MEILNIKDLSFKYPTSARNAICGLDLTVDEGSFVILCGESGSGKTTLLRLIKNELAPHGQMSGSITLFGKNITEQTLEESATLTGYVMQNPENQIVTEYVRSELSFALENLGMAKADIKRRVGEICTVFGLTGEIERHTHQLSGGQKQILNLASVMTYSPALLLLDEPSAYLDPVSAERFFETVRRLNRENGVTVIVSEHRCGSMFEFADKIAVLNKGKLVAYGSADEVVKNCAGDSVSGAFPTYARLWQKYGDGTECPENIPMARCFFRKIADKLNVTDTKRKFNANRSETVLEAKGVRFRYDKNGRDVLSDASIKVHKGEILCLVGGNGSGKSTLLKVLSGIKRPVDGKVELFGKKLSSYGDALYKNGVTYLQQNAKLTFITDKVIADLRITAADTYGEKSEEAINDITRKLNIEHLLEKNPLDLSGGELQLCAVVKALLTAPRVLLLDEPEKGVDHATKTILSETLLKISEEGTSVVIVTHDLEFASRTADSCALMFDGEVVSRKPCAEFFLTGEIYTTETVKFTRGTDKVAVCVEDLA